MHEVPEPQKIIACVYGFSTQYSQGVAFQRCHGSEGSEVLYDPNTSIEQYQQHFESEARKSMPDASEVILYTLKLTNHKPDGTFKRDIEGHRLETTIFKNTRISFE